MAMVHLNTNGSGAQTTTSYYLPTLKSYLSGWNVAETAGSTALVKIRDQLELTTKPTVADGAAGNSTSGLHFVATTWVTIHGESVIGGTSGTHWVEFTTAGSKIYSLTAVPIAPINADGLHSKIDTTVVGRRVYMTKAGAPATGVNPTNAQWFLVTADTSTTVAAGMNNMFMPLTNGSLTVASTTGFAAAGNILVTTGLGKQVITYTSVDATHFLGCTGGQGLLTTANAVTQPAFFTDNILTSASVNVADGSFTSTHPPIMDTAGKQVERIPLVANQGVGDNYGADVVSSQNGGGFGVEVTSGTVDWTLKGA